MTFLFMLIVLIAIILTGLLFKIIHVIKTDEEETSFKMLSFFVKTGLIIFIISNIILTVISLIYISDQMIFIVITIKSIIFTVYFIKMSYLARDLLQNLEEDNIYTIQNAVLTKEIGLLFLYLSVTEIIVGFGLSLIAISSSGSFNITISTTMFVYAVIGLVLHLVSKILYKATIIYEENKLTI